jgi:hypothetical protein
MLRQWGGLGKKIAHPSASTWGLAMATLTFAGATPAFAAATQAKLMATQAMYFQKFF